MNLYSQLLETARNAGIQVIGKDKAARILAIVYKYGDENSVYSYKLKSDINHICKDYGFSGGGVPDREVTDKFKQYARELEAPEKAKWLKEIEKEYDVKFLRTG